MATSERASASPSRLKPKSAEFRGRQLALTAVILALTSLVAFPFLTSIGWAAVLAVAEYPLFRRALRSFPHRPVFVACAFAFITALIVILPFSLAAFSLAQESQAAMSWLQHAQQSGITPPSWLSGLPFGEKLTTAWQQHLASPKAAQTLLGGVSVPWVLQWTRSIGAEVAKDIALFLITLIVLASLLVRGEKIAVQSQMISQHMFGEFGVHFVDRLTDAVRATVSGLLLVSFLEGGIIGVGYIVTGVPQPLLFATLTIILALVPFGAWAAFGLAGLILIGSGSIFSGIALVIFGIVIMTVGDNVVQPALIGSAVELPFILAFIGAFGGLAAFGLIGLFIGPVIVSAMLLVWQLWMDPMEAKSRRAHAA